MRKIRKQKEPKANSIPTREGILNAAIQMMAKQGFSSTSFQNIADKCQVSQSAVMYYFPTKEALVEEAIGFVVLQNHALVSSKIEPRNDAKERLLKHFFGNLEWALAHTESAQLISLLYYFATFSPSFSKQYTAIKSAAQLRIQEILYAGMREKLLAPSIQVEEVAGRLHDLLLGGIINVITQPLGQRELEARSLKKSWEQWIDRLFRS